MTALPDRRRTRLLRGRMVGLRVRCACVSVGGGMPGTALQQRHIDYNIM